MSIYNTRIVGALNEPLYFETSQGAGYSVQNNQISTAPRSSDTSFWKNLADLVKLGAETYRDIQVAKIQSKLIPAQLQYQEALERIGNQSAKSPIVLSVPEKKSTGNIIDDIFGSFRTISQAPQLVEKVETSTKQAQLGMYILGGAIILLALALIMRR